VLELAGGLVRNPVRKQTGKSILQVVFAGAQRRRRAEGESVGFRVVHV
jgi:hypothetical protein